MSERVDSAELKLQPDQLTSSIRSSSRYLYDLYSGRNYALASDAVTSFSGGYVLNSNGTSTGYCGKQIAVSQDTFEHSGNGKTLRLSFDIKRTGVDASTSSTVGVYSAIWVYYTYLDTATNTYKTTGRGDYLRTTDSDFVATDSSWVRMRKGPMDITSFAPTGIA